MKAALMLGILLSLLTLRSARAEDLSIQQNAELERSFKHYCLHHRRGEKYAGDSKWISRICVYAFKWTKRYGIEDYNDWMLAILLRESGLDPHAINGVCFGIGQIAPGGAKLYGEQLFRRYKFRRPIHDAQYQVALAVAEFSAKLYAMEMEPALATVCYNGSGLSAIKYGRSVVRLRREIFE